MSVVIDGTSGVTTPGVVNTAGETIATTLSVTGATNLAVSSGNVGIGTASPVHQLQVGSTSGNLALGGALTTNATSRLKFLGSNTVTNWQISQNDSIVGAFEIIPSTVAGGSTFTTPTAVITSAGLFQFNSGYGSAATAYGCRAWVNFNGTASGTFAGGASTVTRIAASTTATITTTTAHGLITGNTVYALTGVVAGAYTVTVLTTTTFTITTVATTALSAVSITFAVNSIRGSGNVSSITDRGTGLYTLNFTTAMPDANYSGVSSCTVGGAANVNRDSAVGPVNTTSAYCNSFDSSSGSGLDVDVICAAIFR